MSLSGVALATKGRAPARKGVLEARAGAGADPEPAAHRWPAPMPAPRRAVEERLAPAELRVQLAPDVFHHDRDAR